MYKIACRAHFCHLPGLGEVGHSPRGTSGSAEPGTGAQFGWAPSPPATSNAPPTPQWPQMPPHTPYTLYAPIPLLA